MPKLLITESCTVNYGDDRGGVHEDMGAIVEVSKDTARALTTIGRALYVERKEDPDKNARHTASREMLAAAGELRKAKAPKPEK
jgi:hypothetical protein